MDKKYELTDETITIDGTKVLHRIKAIKDFGCVKACIFLVMKNITKH